MRLPGSWRAIASIRFAFPAPKLRSRRGVSIQPGATALTRIGARSSASVRASDSTAESAAVCADACGRIRDAYIPDISVIEPSRIFGATVRTTLKAPNTRASNGRRNSSAGLVSTSEVPPCPTETKTWSTTPRCATARATPSTSVTSVERQSDPAIVAEAVRSFSASRPMIVTDAPSAWASRAVANPMPELPPNTTTTRPVNARAMLMPAQIGRDQLGIMHQGRGRTRVDHFSGLQHIAEVGGLERGTRVLLDQQDRDAKLAQRGDD